MVVVLTLQGQLLPSDGEGVGPDVERYLGSGRRWHLAGRVHI